MMRRREFLQASIASVIGAGQAFAADERQMLTRTVPASGEAMPVVGFGNSNAFRENDDAATKLVLDVLREKGGRFVDIHGPSEGPLGRYMDRHDAHDDFFIGTNLYVSGDTSPADRIRQSQKVLGREPLELLFLPRPGDIRQQWPAMRQFKEQGLARHIGVAATGERFFPLLEQLIESRTIDFIQINYSMLEPEAGDRLLPKAMDNGVAVVVNRPFVNGQYFPLVSGQALPEWAREFDCDSWAQFSLKFIIANPAVTCVITETSKPHHAADNLSAGFGRLPDEDMRRLMLQTMHELAS